MATVGLSDIYYALASSDGDGSVTYGTPKLLSQGIKVDLSIDVSEAKLYASDRLHSMIREFKEGKITINIPDIGNTVTAELLGAKLDANGGLVSSGEDSPPYVALGFKARKDGDSYRYFWFYKVKFGVPSESYQTRGESASFQTPTIEGLITVSDEEDERGKHNWKYQIDDDAPGVKQSVIDSWFDSVVRPDFDGMED